MTVFCEECFIALQAPKMMHNVRLILGFIWVEVFDIQKWKNR